ncbi:MAG: hypothetical protein SGILL_001247 [Bacillariaceae sp.]
MSAAEAAIDLTTEDDAAQPIDLTTDELEEDFVTLGQIQDDEQDQSDDDDDEAQANLNQQLSNNHLPPWMPQPVDYRHTNLLVALHNEIVQFCKLMEPRDDETKQRQQLVDRFTKLAKECFSDDPTCNVQIFGSQATGLFLPESDIDIAIQLKDDTKHSKTEEEKEKGNNGKKKQNGKKQGTTEEGEAASTDIVPSNNKLVSKQQELDDMKDWDKPAGSPLQRLASALREHWMSELSYLEVIENTRVPLVKFTHAPSGICVDVCFNQTGGPQAALLMHRYMEALPPLRPLTFLLKQFMASRSLNQPYTGGVGSFLLQMMIVSFLQHRERDAYNNRRPSLCNLGALLIEFLEFYSTDFNFILTGISVRFDGFFFPKGDKDRKKDFWQPNRQFSIAMENPLDPSHDVGSPSFRISAVQRSFEVAFKTLLCHTTEPIIPTVSILASILPSWCYQNLWKRAKTQRSLNGESIPPPPPLSRQHQSSGSVSAHEPPRKRQRITDLTGN